MNYQILTVGLKDDLLSTCREYFSNRDIKLKYAVNISETAHILEREAVHLLVLDMEYLDHVFVPA